MLLNAGGVGTRVGGVELDEDLPRVHRVAVLHEHPFDDAGLERLNGLGAIADDNATLRDGDDVDLARIDQTSAATNSAQIAQAKRLGAGCAGDS